MGASYLEHLHPTPANINPFSYSANPAALPGFEGPFCSGDLNLFKKLFSTMDLDNSDY